MTNVSARALMKSLRMLALGAIAFSPTILLVPNAVAANIISFDDNATACGGAVLCSTNGTTGYNGTVAFNLSTITSWFQVDTGSTSYLTGQPAQPANAGDFLVVNNTGVTVTGLTLTITDTFTSSTPSVGPCDGTSICDNFQANKGAAGTGTSFETLSGPDFYQCTNPNLAVGVMPCTSTAGQAAANFQPNMVTYTFGGYSIAPGATFDINFASWNNAAFATAVPGPIAGAGLPGLIAACGGLIALARQRRRRTA